MRMIRVGNQIEVWAPAKLNLFLEVREKRADGFHEIETLMTPVSLYDTLRFNEASDSDSLDVRLSPTLQREGTDCPESADNLVLRAIDLLRRHSGIDQYARVELTKRIPSQAGLGGGSSDAAAAMLAANSAWGLDLSCDELASLSAELGSDIPFFFTGGPAVCRGRGEIVTAERLRKFHAVVVKPAAGLSTKDVFQRVDLSTNRKPVEDLLKSVDHLADFATGMFNRLEFAAELLSPWIERLRTIFHGLGLWGHQLSGSGSSYFGICRSARHARCVAQKLRGCNLGAVFAVRTDLSSIGHLATAQS